jgi:inversin
MHAAAYFGSPPIVKLLLQAGADPNVEDASGQPPLFYACEAGHSEVVGALLDADAAATYLDPEQRTLLHWASVGGHTAVCQALLDSQQIDVNGRDASGRTALHNAAYAVHPELVQLLLQHQADPNAQDEQGISAVHWAASRQSSGVIQALIDYKAFVNHTEYHPERLTPLDYAAMTGNKEVRPSMFVQVFVP